MSISALSDCHDCQSGDIASLERTRYFPGQVVCPEDLTQDQRYLRERQRRHNRLLHGWGIVCGVRVAHESSCEVRVEAGYVLGPYGDEILVPEDVTVDVCHEDIDGFAVCESPDPWCSDVRPVGEARGPRYLAVRACERPSRPVRVISCGCGCDDSECEYSRTRDGYAFKVLDELPDSYVPTDPPQTAWDDAISCVNGRRGACPPCPSEPWVILADLFFDGADLVDVRCDPHRRYVASFAGFWFVCANGRDDRIAITPVGPSVAVRLGGHWAHVPVDLDVREGDTYASMLRRVGDAAYRDPATGREYALADLFAAAGVDADAPVRTTDDALAPLEGRSLDVDGLLIVRGAVDALLDAGGRERLSHNHAGDPAAAGRLAATDLTGIEAGSVVRKRLAAATIAEVAAEPEDEFLARMLNRVAKSRREATERQARTVQSTARRVASLASAWREQRA